MIRVFIGYDPRETVAFHVAAHSILRCSSVPVSIIGLRLPQLPELTRRHEGSTEFTFSRFLVPSRCDFKGVAIFMDCDVLVRADIAELVNSLPDEKAVAVVMHDYVPRDDVKFLGNAQTVYPRKNWSSVVVFNNARCRALTPEYVNTASGLDLHRFKWLPDEAISELPQEWNHLVGEFKPNPGAKIAHFTRGGPWLRDYRDCEFASEWYEERALMLAYVDRHVVSEPERASRGRGARVTH